MTEFTPFTYTPSYMESKNIVSLCIANLLKNDIATLIDEFNKEYSSGFSLFDNKIYNINNEFIHKNRGGHPFEPLIKFLSKYCKETNNTEFNTILEKIDTMPNYQKIDLTECLTYMINYRKIKSMLKRDAIFQDLLSLLIHKYNIIDNISNSGLSYMWIIKRDQSSSIKITKCEAYIRPNDVCDNLKMLIVRDSLYKNISVRNDVDRYYTKTLIQNNKINYFEILRSFIFEDDDIKFSNTKIKIPKILNLPEIVFVDNNKRSLELLAIVIYDSNLRQYSIIIKESNGKYYHHLHDRVIKTDDEYFDHYTSKYSTGVFYGNITE
jgi:hypothetical protein